MLQQPEPDDYVLATGKTHSVREFVELAFAEVARRTEWTGDGVDGKGIDLASGKVLVEVDPCYYRPTEVGLLHGDPSKARQRLNRSPRTSFRNLVKEMVRSDREEVAAEANRRQRHG